MINFIYKRLLFVKLNCYVVCSKSGAKSLFFLIPLFFILLTTSYSLAVDENFSSFVETFPNGKIDWDAGYFYGVGKGFPHLNDGSKAKALKVAQAGALSAILQVASGLRVDDLHTLGDLEKERTAIRITAIVHYESYSREFIKERGYPCFRVTYRAPITGVEGLTSCLLDHLEPSSSSSSRRHGAKQDPALDFSGPLPWLLLDARGLEQQASVQPALFPKVVAENGEIIYERGKTDESALEKRGMARYVVSDKSHEELMSWSAGNPLVTLIRLISPGLAQAETKQKRKKRGKYIISNVRQAEGFMKTNLIISEVDARKIRGEDASSRILKNCRVIVIVSSSLAGIEGKLMEFFALGR